jgi:hypothetical protein
MGRPLYPPLAADGGSPTGLRGRNFENRHGKGSSERP